MTESESAVELPSHEWKTLNLGMATSGRRCPPPGMTNRPDGAKTQHAGGHEDAWKV